MSSVTRTNKISPLLGPLPVSEAALRSVKLPTCVICFQESLVVVPMCHSAVPHLICINCLNIACFSTRVVDLPWSNGWDHCAIADETGNLQKCPVCKSPSTLSAAPVLPPVETYSAIFPDCELGGPIVMLDGVTMSLHSAISHIFRMQCQQRDLPLLVRQRAYYSDPTLPGDRSAAQIAISHNVIEFPALRLPMLSLVDYRPSITCACGTVVSVPADHSVYYTSDPPRSLLDAAKSKLNIHFLDHLHEQCHMLKCQECGSRAGSGTYAEIQIHSALHRLQRRVQRALPTPATSILANARLLADTLDAVTESFDLPVPDRTTNDLLLRHTASLVTNQTARSLMQLLTARL